jgi:transcriptional regulator with XRE-family HTH domain
VKTVTQSDEIDAERSWQVREEVQDAQVALGRRLSYLRKAAGLTQEQLAVSTFVARGSVANIETGRQNTHRDFWERADAVTTADGVLLAAYDQLRRSRRLSSLSDTRPTALRVIDVPDAGNQRRALASRPSSLLDRVNALCGDAALETRPENGAPVRQVVPLPGGVHFNGADIEAELFPAMAERAIMTQVPHGYATAPFLARPGRGLVIGATPAEDGPALYAVDRRPARRQLSGAGRAAQLAIPAAYRLDEITLGLLWAVTNLDEALLDDDRLIAEQRGMLEQYSRFTRSSAGKATVADLNAVSALWLGSDFCARHILRHLDSLEMPSTFWTREQRGEEASAWLFFLHKYEYLDQLSQRVPTIDMTRTFCVPEDAVAGSQTGERVLIFLAMALMESFGIRTQLIAAPEYQDLDGFALDGRRRAIVANWVGCEGVWLVDVTGHRSTVSGYADAASCAAAHGLTVGTTAHTRLRLLADYLCLDWARVLHRCTELTANGLDGLIDPRSRLLSVAGAERACQFVAESRTSAS